MKLWLLPVLVALALWSVPGAVARTYTTQFPVTENPISEGSNWICGKMSGLDWSDLSTTNGLAIGLESGFTGYDDATALLTGKWGPNQTGSATVYTTNRQSGNVFEEVEIRLRSSLSAHRCTGYEVLFSLKPDSSAYVQIVRWNGALGDFSYVAAVGGPQCILQSGDTVSASITNQTITAYINGGLILQGTDTNYASGNPGMGIFIQGAAGLNHDYGLTSFTVTDHEGPSYPLKPSPNGRYLVDQNKTPCLVRSGACGQLYGNHYTWPFSAGWQAQLDTVGATQLSYLKAFFEPRAWYALVPDTNHTVVTTGFGTFSSTGHVADNNYLTAARISDGSLVIVYHEPTHVSGVGERVSGTSQPNHSLREWMADLLHSSDANGVAHTSLG